jgi:UDP-2,4-diacetamido-2,4,6-trideoxy-beta-L-altropyranose hydrolase
MNLPRIVFRGDGNSQIGLGHISRLSSVASHLKNKYHRILVANKFSQELNGLTLNCFEEIFEMSLPENQLGTSHEIEKYSSMAEIVVLDGYIFGSAYQKELKQRNKKLVYIDDLAAFEQYADVVINHALRVQPSTYSIQPYTRLCLGPGYLMLRKEFLVHSSVATKKEQSVLICFGGADPDNFTQQVLDNLAELKDVKLKVIIGAANRNFDDLSHGRHVQILKNLNAVQIIEQMQMNALMICSPSTVSYEACAVGIPLIVIRTADNQKMIAEGLVNGRCAIEIQADKMNELRNSVNTLLVHDGFASEVLENQKKLFRQNVSGNFQKIFSELSA